MKNPLALGAMSVLEWLSYRTSDACIGLSPGLTGWCQINGRNALTWEQKFALDVWYVEHRSFWLDVKILFLTVGQVLVRHGISAQDHATMPEFRPPAAEGKGKVKVEEGSEAEEGRQDHGTTGPQD